MHACPLYYRPNEEEDGSKNSVITDQIAISITVDVCSSWYT